jgi:hypothetical protein
VFFALIVIFVNVVSSPRHLVVGAKRPAERRSQRLSVD